MRLVNLLSTWFYTPQSKLEIIVKEYNIHSFGEGLSGQETFRLIYKGCIRFNQAKLWGKGNGILGMAQGLAVQRTCDRKEDQWVWMGWRRKWNEACRWAQAWAQGWGRPYSIPALHFKKTKTKKQMWSLLHQIKVHISKAHLKLYLEKFQSKSN